jgi:hypothetical protein
LVAIVAVDTAENELPKVWMSPTQQQLVSKENTGPVETVQWKIARIYAAMREVLKMDDRYLRSSLT